MLQPNTRTVEISFFVPAADRDVAHAAAAAMLAVALQGRDPEGVACWGDVNVMGTWRLGGLVARETRAVRLRHNGTVAELIRDIEFAQLAVVDFLQIADIAQIVELDREHK